MTKHDDVVTAQKSEVAGFDLYGHRLEDGRVKMGEGSDVRIVDEWPEKVTLGPDFPTYTLEWVRVNKDTGVTEDLDPVEVVDRDMEPGIEWGVYV